MFITKAASILLTLALIAVSAFGFSPNLTPRSIACRTGLVLKMTAELYQKGIVTMYKKETCPYCKKARILLEEKYKLDIKFVDIESENRDDKLLQMRNFSGGRNTVPQVFFNSKHLGGNDDLEKLDASGQLEKEVDVVRNTPTTMMMDHWYHPWY